MVHLFRPVNHHIIDILIGQTEEVCYCYNQFLESSPYPFYNGKFQRVLGDFFKEFSHRFIGCKSFHKGKNVVLQCSQEVAAIWEAKLFAWHFPSPSNPFASLKMTSKAHL